MRQIKDIQNLREYVRARQNEGSTIGFVPTMGALHDGHLSLVDNSCALNSVTIVSIFVNPTQFNNAEDLKKYPRTIEADLDMLRKTDCDVVFLPQVEEIYADEFVPRLVELGFIGTTMEGQFRPGHFDGVVAVVQRLFDLVAPNNAYFGRKDFQQVAVIRKMTKELAYSITIHEVSILREENGLAMSSRNMRLSAEDRQNATAIFRILKETIEIAKTKTPIETKKMVITAFEETNLQLEYFEIVDPFSLEVLHENWVQGATACAVAYCGDVRLLDNIEVIPFA